MPGDIEITLTTNPTADVQNLRTNIQKTLDDAIKDPFDVKLKLNTQDLDAQLKSIRDSVKSTFDGFYSDLLDVANNIGTAINEIQKLNRGTGHYDFEIRTNAIDVSNALSHMTDMIDSFNAGDRTEFTITADLYIEPFNAKIDEVKNELRVIQNGGEPYEINVTANIDRAKKDIDAAKQVMKKYIADASAQQTSFTETNEITPTLTITSNLDDVIQRVNDLAGALDSLTKGEHNVTIDVGGNIDKFMSNAVVLMDLLSNGFFAKSTRREFDDVVGSMGELIQEMEGMMEAFRQLQFSQTPAGQRSILYADTYNGLISTFEHALDALTPLMKEAYGIEGAIKDQFDFSWADSLKQKAEAMADAVKETMALLEEAGMGGKALMRLRDIGFTQPDRIDNILARAEKQVSLAGKFNDFLNGGKAGDIDTSSITGLSSAVGELKSAIGSMKLSTISSGFESVVSSIEKVEDAVKKTTEAVDLLKGSLSSVGSGTAGSALSDTINSISTALGTFKEGTNGSIVDTLTRMATAVESLNQAISNADFVKTFEGLPQVISSINESLSTLKGFLDGVQAKSAETGNSGQQAFEGIRQGSEVAKESLRGVGEQATATGSQISDLEKAENDFLLAWKSTSGRGGFLYKDKYMKESIFGGLSDLLKKLYDPIKSEAKTLGGSGNPIVKYLSTFTANTKTGVQDILDDLKNPLTSFEEKIKNMLELVFMVRESLENTPKNENYKTISDLLSNFTVGIDGKASNDIYAFADAIKYFLSVCEGKQDNISSYNEMVAKLGAMPSLKISPNDISAESELYRRALDNMSEATKSYMREIDASFGKGTSNKVLDTLNRIPSLASRLGIESGKFKQFFKSDFLGGNIEPTLENLQKVMQMFDTLQKLYEVSDSRQGNGQRPEILNFFDPWDQSDFEDKIHNIYDRYSKIALFIRDAKNLMSSADTLKSFGVDPNAVIGDKALEGAKKYSEAAQIKSEADKQMTENTPTATTSPFIESIKAGVADVKTAVENVKQAIDDLKDALSGLNGGQSSDVFKAISESIMGISKAIGTIGEGKASDIITTFSNMSSYIKQIMGDLQTLKNTFKTGFVAPDTSTVAIDNIGTKLDDTKNKFAETGAAGSAAMAEVTQGAEQVGDAIERVKQEWASRMEGITSENDIWTSARDTLKEWAGSVDKIIKKGMSGSSVAGRTSVEKWINSVSDISHLELFKNIKSAMKSEDIEEQTRAYYDYIKLVKELDEATLRSSDVRAKVLGMGKELEAFFNGDMVTGARNADAIMQNATQNIDTLHQYNDALSEAQAKSQQLNDEAARQSSTATNIGAVAEQAGKLNEAMSSISAETFNSSIASINTNIGLVKTAVEDVTGAIGKLKEALSGLSSNQPSDAFKTMSDTIQGVSKVIGTFGEGVDSSIVKVLTDISSAVTQLGQLPSNSGFIKSFEGVSQVISDISSNLSTLKGITESGSSGNAASNTMSQELTDISDKAKEAGVTVESFVEKFTAAVEGFGGYGKGYMYGVVDDVKETLNGWTPDSRVLEFFDDLIGKVNSGGGFNTIASGLQLIRDSAEPVDDALKKVADEVNNLYTNGSKNSIPLSYEGIQRTIKMLSVVRRYINKNYEPFSKQIGVSGTDFYNWIIENGTAAEKALFFIDKFDTAISKEGLKIQDYVNASKTQHGFTSVITGLSESFHDFFRYRQVSDLNEILVDRDALDTYIKGRKHDIKDYEAIYRAFQEMNTNTGIWSDVSVGNNRLTLTLDQLHQIVEVCPQAQKLIDEIMETRSFNAPVEFTPSEGDKALEGAQKLAEAAQVKADAEQKMVEPATPTTNNVQTQIEGEAQAAEQTAKVLSSISLDDIKSQFASVVDEIKKVVSAIDDLKKSLEGVGTASGITALGDRIEQGLGRVISAIGKVRKAVGDLPTKINIDTSEAENKLNNVGQQAKDVANDVNSAEGHVKVDGAEAEQTMMKLGREAADLRENLAGATADTNAVPTNAETSMQGVSDVLSSIIAKAEDGKYVMAGLGEVFTEVTSDANKIYEKFANIYGPNDDSLKKWYDTMSGITKLVPDIFGKSKMQQPDTTGLKATVDEMKSAISEYLRLRDEFAKDHGLTLDPLTINDKAVAAMTSAPLREITEAANARVAAESQAANAANESANAEERAASAAHDAAAAEERIAAGEKARTEYQMRIAEMMGDTTNAEEQVASGAERASAATQGMADNVARASEGMAQMGHAISQYETQDIAAALKSQVDISSADADKIAQSISNANVQIKSMQASWSAAAGEADSLLNVIVRGNNELGQSVQYTLNYNTKNGELLDTVTKVAAKFQDINEENKKFSQELNAQQSAQQSLTTLLDNAQKTLAGFAGLKDDAQVGDSYSRLGMLVDDIAKYKDMADTAGMSTQDITENVKRWSSELANLKSELGGIQAQMKDVNAQQNAQKSLTSLLGNSQRALNAYAGIKENPQASEAYSRLGTLVDDIAKFKDMADTAGASTQEITDNVVRWGNALANLKLQLGTVQDEVNANQKASKAASREVIDQEKAQESFTKLLANAQEALKSYQSISGNDKSQGAYADLQSMTSDMEQFQAVIQSTGAATDVIREKTAQYSNTFAGLKATLSSVQSEVDAEAKATQQSAAEHDKHNAALTAYTKALSDVNAMVEKYANSMNSANPLARDAYAGLMNVREGLQALRPDIEAAGTSTEDIKNTTSDARREMEAYKATIEATDGAYQRSVDARKKQLDAQTRYFNQMRRAETLQSKYAGRDLTGYEWAPATRDQLDALIERMKEFKVTIDSGGVSVDQINAKYSEFNEELARLDLELSRTTYENRNYVEVAKRNNALKEYESTLRDVNSTLEKYAAAENSYNSDARSSYLNLQALLAAMSDYRNNVLTNATSTEEIRAKTAEFARELANLKAQIESTGAAHKTFGQSVASMTRMFASWFSGSRIVLYTIRSLRNMIKTTIELDDVMTQMQIVTHASDTTMNEFAKSAADAAKSVGASITDFTTAATTFARLGYSMDESSALARLSTMLQNVGDIEASDAQDALTAILKAFPDEVNVDNMESVMDKLVVVGNSFPISVSQLAEGMNNAASSLAAAGNSFEQSVALMMAANTTVNICRAA